MKIKYTRTYLVKTEQVYEVEVDVERTDILDLIENHGDWDQPDNDLDTYVLDNGTLVSDEEVGVDHDDLSVAIEPTEV